MKIIIILTLLLALILQISSKSRFKDKTKFMNKLKLKSTNKKKALMKSKLKNKKGYNLFNMDDEESGPTPIDFMAEADYLRSLKKSFIIPHYAKPIIPQQESRIIRYGDLPQNDKTINWY